MKPRLMPSMCGRLRRTLKFTPEASSIILLGPGVTEVTKAKRTKAKISSRLMAVTLWLCPQTKARCAETSRYSEPRVERYSRLAPRGSAATVMLLQSGVTHMDENPYAAPRVEL